MSTDTKQGNDDHNFSTKVPDCVVGKCYEHRGVVMPKLMARRCMDQLYKMETRPDDLFIITYLKSGTTWAQQLALLVQFEGDRSKLAGKHVMEMSPFLDIVSDPQNIATSKSLIDLVEAFPSPRIMKSHCLPDWLPEAIRTDDPKTKVIYVVRNPKDTAVSYYNFCTINSRILPSYESWDAFFEEFIAARVPYGSWFENVLPWWKRRNHPNVLFLKFEDMKKDLVGTVRQVARFMGKTLSDDVINEIAAASTFTAMKESKFSNPDFMENDKLALKPDKGKSFMRKGQVGDWKNIFSEDQSKRFDDLYRKEMANSGLELDFDAP